jgi:iron complex transport system substrate-binding protein
MPGLRANERGPAARGRRGPLMEKLASLGALLLLAAAPRAPMRLGPSPKAEPARVITLAPSLTETVLALGAGARLVGVTRFDEAPQVQALPRVGGYSDPSVEAVIALAPDLVLAEPSPGNRAAVERMAKLGTPVLAVSLATEAEILAGFEIIGSALGLGPRGAALAEATRRRIEAVRGRARTLPRIRALLVYDWDPLVVAGPGSFGDALLLDAGGQNAMPQARTAYPVVSAELAVRAAPQVIIDAAMVRAPPRARLLKLPGLAQARVAVASPSLFHPGPRIAEGVEELFSDLHPEAAR